ncbi:MAG: hypothetical protein KF722_14210 [Nitrospira sp.]|nr:hypothetical protein [Nitrospira sp.]
MKQSVDRPSGESARRPREARGQAGRSGESTIAAEVFMNNVAEQFRTVCAF